MKLHELSPAPNSTKAPKRLGRGIAQVLAKLLVRVIKVKTQEAAVELDLDLRAAKCL